MAFSEHKITNFTHRLSDLPDQPNLSAAELKAYFDSSPEELRQAHNALCADADRLDDRVSGIVAGTFGDAIPKAMLSHELQAELDAKAEQSALAAEKAARESADTALAATLAEKCEVYIGTYTGDGAASQVIDLGFTPKAVLIFSDYGATVYDTGANTHVGGLALRDHPANANSSTQLNIEIVENGFRVYYTADRPYARANSGLKYFIAFQ